MPHLSKLTGRTIWQLSLENLTDPSKTKSEESKWVLLHSGSDLLSCRKWNRYLKVPRQGNKLKFSLHGMFGDVWTFVGPFASSGEAETEFQQRDSLEPDLQRCMEKGCLHRHFQHFFRTPPFRRQCWLPWQRLGSAFLLLVGFVPKAPRSPRLMGTVSCAKTATHSQRPSLGCSSLEMPPCRVRAKWAWPQMKVVWLQLKMLHFLLLLLPLIFLFFSKGACVSWHNRLNHELQLKNPVFYYQG